MSNKVVLQEDLDNLKDFFNDQIQALQSMIGENGSGLGGGSLKYRELVDIVNLEAGESIQKDYDLGGNTIVITTLYLDIADGSSFQFQIFDKMSNGFCLYDTFRVSHYSDSVFIPYKDKDIESNKLHSIITNYNLNSSVTLNIKILGLEVQNG